ncbi:diaminopimelate epimerase [Candidatus Poriferisocius sp.]|uniref:diaminopimelate epimerase n=1 Tax=Candidatus Poriferisocius sp. TaxID=3101276 RepID=UPI003B5CE269
MRLTKHHGLGNEFLIALEDELPADPDKLAKRWCDRTGGEGADGLIFGLPGDPDADIDITMVLFNADGSRAEISGNGIRCLAQAVLRQPDRADGGAASLMIATDAGIRQVSVHSDEEGRSVNDARAVRAWVNMGPVTMSRKPVDIDYPHALRMARLDVGNPHLVILVPDVDAVDVAADGERLSAQAGGVNVQFISERPGEDAIDLRVWERGVGVTQACGTGACAAARAARQWGLVGTQLQVFMLGGDVVVQLVGDDVTLIGPAVYVEPEKL